MTSLVGIDKNVDFARSFLNKPLPEHVSERIKKVTDQRKIHSDFEVINDILQTLRFKGTIFFHSKLAAPWGVVFGPMKIPRFHIALSGDCFIGTDSMEAVSIQEMEIVMLPTGHSHWIADQPGRPLISAEEVGEACSLNMPMFQNGVITNRLMCGLVSFDEAVSHPILEALPEILHFAPEDDDGLWNTACLIDQEIQRTGKNTSTIVDRLTEVLFIRLLEEHVKRDYGSSGFIAALRDPRLKQALTLIHREPHLDWSLESLGARVGMSRATLNRHFNNTIGAAPNAYLQDWRLTKAWHLIRHTDLPLDSVAEQVGFASGRTLARAFQRKYGQSPKQARSETQAKREDYNKGSSSKQT